MLFFVRRRSIKQRKMLNTFTKIVQMQKAYSTYNNNPSKKVSFARLQELRLPFIQTSGNGVPILGTNKFNYNQMQLLFNKLYTLSPSSGVALQIMSAYNPSFFNMYLSIADTTATKNTSVAKERIPHTNRLSRFTRRAHDRYAYVHRTNLEGSFSEKQAILAQKLSHYQKLAFSLQFRKAALPSSFRYISKQKRQAFVRHHTFKRTKLLRFYFKKYKKAVQNKKRIRLKGVHFYIPSYLQMDFRTLRAIKIQSPSQTDIYYPFRVSLAKRYSFYRSRGY